MNATRLLTSGELADVLGISRRSVARYAADGSLTPEMVTPGGQYRWSLEDARRQLREIAESRKRS